MEINPYHAYKISERIWGVVFRLGERTSIDQRLRFPTKRAAESCASSFNREHRELNGRLEVQ